MIFAWLRVARFLTLSPLCNSHANWTPFYLHPIGSTVMGSDSCWLLPKQNTFVGQSRVDTNSKQKVSIIAEEAGQEFNWQLIELGKHHWQCQVATIQSLMASPTIQACSSQRQIVFCIIWIWIWIIWIILANTTGSAKWQVPAIRFLLASLTVTFLHLSVSASVNK